MRRVVAALFAVALPCAFWPAIAQAREVRVQVDRGSQTMAVSLDGEPLHTWRVSTGRSGFATPAGTFRAQWMAARWFSHVYSNAPMPHAIFFYGGFAIHGSYETARLGAPASHGCVRLSPNDAALLYELVEREGIRNTTIVVR